MAAKPKAPAKKSAAKKPPEDAPPEETDEPSGPIDRPRGHKGEPKSPDQPRARAAAFSIVHDVIVTKGPIHPVTGEPVEAGERISLKPSWARNFVREGRGRYATAEDDAETDEG
jgi:hypothetical protein